MAGFSLFYHFSFAEQLSQNKEDLAILLPKELGILGGFKENLPLDTGTGVLVVGGSADAFGGSWGFVSLRREENLGEVSL